MHKTVSCYLSLDKNFKVLLPKGMMVPCFLFLVYFSKLYRNGALLSLEKTIVKLAETNNPKAVHGHKMRTRCFFHHTR